MPPVDQVAFFNLIIENRFMTQDRIDTFGTYFDYLNGRVMKIEIGGDELSARTYDRDNGADAVVAVGA